MPEIGIPTSKIQNELRKVSIRKDAREGLQETAKQKQDILEKVSGKKVKIPGAIEPRKTSKTIGKDEFLKMLAHQMQNQDPLNPMDQNKFAADLAQFSQLEQLTHLNKKMDGLKENSIMERKFFAANFIGKSIVTDGNTVELDSDGQKKNLHFNLDGNAKHAIVRLHDSKNNIAGEIKLENLPKGANSVEWNGKAMDGFDVPKGKYRIVVQAWDEKFEPIQSKTQFEGTVKSVYFDGSEPIFDIGNKKVALRDVSSFHDGKTIKKLGSKKAQPASADIKKYVENSKQVVQ